MNASRRVCLWLFCFLAVVLGAQSASAQLVINEIDYDQIGTDGAEFVELKNTSGSPINLDNYTLEWVNGNGGGAVLYGTTVDLPNVNLAAGDYFVICGNAANTPNCDMDVLPDTDLIQNGNPDGIGLRLSGVLVDAVSYEGNTGAPYTEGTGTPNNAVGADSNTVANIGLSRLPDGTDTNNNSADLTIRCITPGTANVAANTACPAPSALPNLTVTDVTQAETNAGTTTFTFQVNLSAPAGPGGVTFNIATADGTAEDDTPATEDNDYVAQSLAGQTIAAGNSSFAFNVTVNGDAVPETNETFFVNVTAVTGANVTDGQGQGTITNDDAAINLTINDVTQAETNAGTTTFTFTVSLDAPAGPGGVTFDIATADGTAQDDTPATEDNDYVQQTLTGQTIAAGNNSYSFNVTVNGDTTPEGNETFFVNVTNVTGAVVVDGQGLGTITNDDLTRIHQVQGSGAATPMPGATVTIEAIVTGVYQPVPNDIRLRGFFVQEENADVDGIAATSEGLFIFCNTCPTAVAEGDRVQVTGAVSEFNNSTQITASTAGSVVIVNSGNPLPTPATINLPVTDPSIDAFYEPMESMLVTYTDTLSISEYFEQARYGRIELYEGGRPRQFTEANAPSAPGYAAHLDNLARRRVYLDDDDNVENSPLLLPNGSQFVYHPRVNGGLSIGTQGIDFFRGGDQISGLTGLLHWSFSGGPSPDEWRVRPMSLTPSSMTVTNPRPATPPAVGGAIRVAAANVLNYFTTLNQRGADSPAELNRQRERTSIVLCSLDADVAALMEIENGNTAIADLLADVNSRCGGANPYAFVNTGGAIGTDEIRVMLIYRTGVVAPVGAPLVDTDPVHNRPPTAQIFDVVDNTNPAFGERFTAVANHSKSKGSCPGSGPDADQNDGQGCFGPTRVAQHNRILTWVNGTVIPAAGDPDVLLLGDFNAYAQETATTTLTSGGYTDLETAFLGSNAYSYVFDGQLGHLDYAFSSASMTPQVTGVNVWHINADENPLFDYNDEIDDGAAEAAFEEKPDGSALVPPRVLFQPASPYRASDHDPIILGIFAISDLEVIKSDSPDPVTAGTNLTYTITVTNNGPDAAANAQWTDTIPTDTTFVSMPANTGVGGWSCTTGPTITCNNPSFGVGSSFFTLTVAVDPDYTGLPLSNSATATSSSAEGNPGNETGTAATTVVSSADLTVTKTDTPDPVTAGNDMTYTITVNNAGPSNAATVQLTDAVPANTTFVSFTQPGGWSCSDPGAGNTGNVTCTNASLGLGNAVFTLVVNVNPGTADGTIIQNDAVVTSATSDPDGDLTGTATTTVATSANLTVTKTDSPDPVDAGSNLTYTISVLNAGPSSASTVALTDAVPADTTFVSVSAPLGWTCGTQPPVGGTGNVICTNPSMAPGTANITLVVNVNPSTADGTTLSNTATVTTTTTDPSMGDQTDTETTMVEASADLSVAKVDTPDPVTAGTVLTYTITLNNAGPSTATGLTLTDAVPANTTFVSFTEPGGWTCTTPAVGGTGTISCTNPSVPIGNQVFTLAVTVGAAVPNGTIITNSATVTSATTDPNTGNETGTATTSVGFGSADLSVTKTDSPDPVNAGANITYTITVNNAGPSSATTVQLSDTVPANTTFVSLAAPAGWSCTTPPNGGTGAITCTNASVAVGSNVFTLVVAVSPNAAPGTVISNTATVASATTDPNTGNESDTETTSVLSPANVSGTKTASGSFAAGNTVTYTVTLSNSGPSAQANNPGDEFVDVLPSQLTLISATATSGTAVANVGTNTVTWNGSIAAGGSVTITIQALVEANVPTGTSISNQGTINYDADGNGTNESSTVTDDPSQPGTGNPTIFISAPASVGGVPALDGFGLAALAALLAGLGLLVMRRS
jgi:uncharacterized protein